MPVPSLQLLYDELDVIDSSINAINSELSYNFDILQQKVFYKQF